ncbi:MAG: hypothetical protein IKC08_08220, partial [Lentisphaeria bacterium]|nr:hypothetical protein [Lentisphaeria bacterium]
MKKTSTLFIFLTLVLFTAILCAADVASIKIPSGTNLWATAASPGGLDKWSGSKKFTMELNRKENTLLLTSSQTGYSFGPHRSFVLKPATTYTYYAVARGKIAKGSKVIFLYMTDNRKGKTPLFARRADTRTEDFPWTLFTVKFTTPSAGSYPGGTASFRFALLYGSCQLEFASVGLVEEGKKKLPELSKKYRNILNNTVFAPGLNGYPADWNDGFEEDKDFFRFEKDKDGKISAALLPRKTPLALRQKDIRLNAGKRYRIGAWVKTRDLTAARSGIIVYNFLWQKEVGTGKLPVNTDGWEKIEAEVTLPGSRFELYTFAIYTVGNEKGAIQIKDPFLIPVDDEAARSAGATAPSRLYKITPVKPLLSKISGIKPEMTFSFRYLLPKKEDQYICVVRTKMEGMKDFSPPAKFPLKNFMIHAELGKLKTGKGILKAEILDKTDKKKIAS